MMFFTMLFSGGLVPSYIINTRYLHLNNTVWIFLLPSLASAYNVIILRTFILSTIPIRCLKRRASMARGISGCLSASCCRCSRRA